MEDVFENIIFKHMEYVTKSVSKIRNVNVFLFWRALPSMYKEITAIAHSLWTVCVLLTILRIFTS